MTLPRLRNLRPWALAVAVRFVADVLFVLAFLLVVPTLLLVALSWVLNGNYAQLLFTPDEYLAPIERSDEEMAELVDGGESDP